MVPDSGRGARGVVLGVIVIQTLGAAGLARAEHRLRRAGRAGVVTRARPVAAPQPAPLGTFMPTPYIMVAGSYPASMAGYSPMGISGDYTLALYGPFSALRSTTAPVVTYSRGYNGEVRVHETVTASYPNQPMLSPVIYPTRANNYYAPRIIRAPWWDSAVNWIDQN